MMPYQTERSVLAKELELRRHVTSIHRVSEKGSSRKPTYRLLNEPRFAPVLGLKMPAQGKKTSRKFFEGGVLWTYLPLLSGPWWAQLQAGCSCICLANSRTSTSSGPRVASEERGAPVQGIVAIITCADRARGLSPPR